MQKNIPTCILSTFFEPLSRVLDDIKDKPIYITLDIDVVDPAYANGTGTPGARRDQLQGTLDSIHLFKGANLVGFDIVEVSPPL